MNENNQEGIIQNDSPNLERNLRDQRRDIFIVGVFFAFAIGAVSLLWIYWNKKQEVGLTELAVIISWGIVFFVLQIPIHEGLHAIAGHWYTPKGTIISASGRHTYINASVPKKTWIKFALFPLLFPLAGALLIVPFDPPLSIIFFIFFCSASAGDLIDILIIRRQPGTMVTDIETGLSCD